MRSCRVTAMIVLISYDIGDPARLRRMHEFLKDYGISTQKSVFECDISAAKVEAIKRYANNNLEPSADALRIYRICDNCMDRVRLIGQGLRVTHMDFEIM